MRAPRGISIITFESRTGFWNARGKWSFALRILILTNEYPPNIYGGAGVHVEYLVRELAALEDSNLRIQVLCFGNQNADHRNLQVRGIDPATHRETTPVRHPEFLKTFAREVAMIGAANEADIVHCHTWYTHLAGCLLKQLLGARLVLTTHSLEPHRPWKAEQLGTAYHASAWMEKTAYENADGVIAVSGAMKEDVQQLYGVSREKIRVIYNGIDTDEYRRRIFPEVLDRYGIDRRKPFVLFVGRITRQKGIFHLLSAIPGIKSDAQIVLCAGAPDTRELESEMESGIQQTRSQTRNPVIWIPKMVPKPDIISLYSAASIFVCPSIYEPFGIINLEAMACGTPVVASAVGGIPEIVVPEETGLLVSYDARDPDKFSKDLAVSIDSLLASPATMESMGRKARQRVETRFSWKSIALQTLGFYRELHSEPGC
jgi:alpha-maltose-1-phosphate synthase